MRLTQILGVISLAILTVTIAACIPFFKQTDRPYEKDSSGKPVNPDLDLLATGNNEFAFDMYRLLADGNDDNIFFSPYSIRTALAMTYAGARGKTAEDMRSVLKLNLPDDRLHPAMKSISRHLESVNGRNVTLDIANALWGQKKYKYEQAFLDLNKQYYQGGFREVDFASDSSRRTINGWVSDHTHGHITDLLKPGSLTSDTRLVLTNAVYFKGRWRDEFSQSATDERDFEPVGYPDHTKKVQMMHATHDYPYFANATIQMIKLPYRGDKVSMMMILPKTRHGLKEAMIEITAANIKKWSELAKSTEVIVSTPKLEFASSMKMTKTLKLMQMHVPFSGQADFSGMTTQEPLCISDVIHEARLKVDEEGTVAVAATAVTMIAGAAPSMIPKPEPIRFTVDQPAICAIIDNPTGTILFMGRISNPK